MANALRLVEDSPRAELAAAISGLDDATKAAEAARKAVGIATGSIADAAIQAGVRVILNFAPIILRVPERIVVRNVSFLQELAVLSYHLSSETHT